MARRPRGAGPPGTSFRARSPKTTMARDSPAPGMHFADSVTAAASLPFCPAVRPGHIETVIRGIAARGARGPI